MNAIYRHKTNGRAYVTFGSLAVRQWLGTGGPLWGLHAAELRQLM